jgi:hypothetical protein
MRDEPLVDGTQFEFVVGNQQRRFHDRLGWRSAKPNTSTRRVGDRAEPMSLSLVEA